MKIFWVILLRALAIKKYLILKTPIILTDPTLKQPVIDNAKAMTQIATRWVDKNIDVIKKNEEFITTGFKG